MSVTKITEPTTYETETGSIYQVDPIAMRVRRLNDCANDSNRVGFDGAWQNYVSFQVVESKIRLFPGAFVTRRHLVFIWPDSVSHEPDSIPTTVTSAIVKEVKQV